MQYDVTILGAGLAGLTLALQLKKKRPGIRIVMVEMRGFPMPEAAHKVGESTVELGARYLSHTLGLESYLQKNHVEKGGLRFYFSTGDENDLAEKVEVGNSLWPDYLSYQLDRGVLENDLYEMCLDLGIDVLTDTKPIDVRLDKIKETDVVGRDGLQQTLRSKWLVDATGRKSLLKKQLGLQESVKHDNHACWFRIDRKIDLDELTQDAGWQKMAAPGLRHSSTNHIMGEGYWVWVIPLSNGRTSIGIVADNNLVKPPKINRLNRSLAWLQENEPVIYEAVGGADTTTLDFRYYNDYSAMSKQLFNARGWAITGEAGAFIDPFYSPGTDMISISNTYITEMINSSLEGTLKGAHAKHYENSFKRLVESMWVTYRDQYPLFGRPDIMVPKIVWDYTVYWSSVARLFSSDTFAEPRRLPAVDQALLEITKMNKRMQDHFRQMNTQAAEPFSRRFFDIPNERVTPKLLALQESLREQISACELPGKLLENIAYLRELEAIILSSENLDDFAEKYYSFEQRLEQPSAAAGADSVRLPLLDVPAAVG
mgnify:CR=1 FL=1